MKKIKLVVVLLSVVSLSACEQGSKQGFGTILGAIGGAAVGSAVGGNNNGTGKVVAVALGTLAGAAIGSSIGKSLDKADRHAMTQSRQAALESYPTGQVASWYNPDTGNSGNYVPQPAYKNAAGRYCREFQQTITVGGRNEEAYGKACRQADGTWKIER